MEDLLQICNECYGTGKRPSTRNPNKEVGCHNCGGTCKTLTEAGEKLKEFLAHIRVVENE